MAIQINVPMMDRDQSVIASGSYCVLDIHFTTRNVLDVGTIFYASKAAFDNLEPPVDPVAIYQRFGGQLTDQQYQDFSYTTVHLLAQSHIEKTLGPGTTQIVQ